MKKISRWNRVYGDWYVMTVANTYFSGVHYVAYKADDEENTTFERGKISEVRAVIDHYNATGNFVPDLGKPDPRDYDASVTGVDVKRNYKGWAIQKHAGLSGPRRGYATWYEAKKNGESHKHAKLKTLKWIIDDVEQDRAKTMAVKKKRKVTPAQLRALAKGRATAARNRKRKAPKRKRVVRRARNPARGNYQKARAVARGVNPVASAYWVIRVPSRYKNHGGNYYNGAELYGGPKSAVLFQSQHKAKEVAEKLANATGFQLEVLRRGTK